MDELILKSIGVFESEQKEPYQAGRQPDERGLPGVIRLHSGCNFEQALTDLGGCSHIWVIFGFHHNSNWKPLVLTPRSDRKIGVFATRAPYRPNPLGLSLVKITDIDGLSIQVSANDILDGSPIYDIKPYHPEYDLPQEEAKIAWLDEALVAHPKNKIHISPLAQEQLEFLEAETLNELRPFIYRQLEYDPLNSKKKRVEEKGGFYTLAYRTWRVDFTAHDDSIGLLAIHSGYSVEDLNEQAADYVDPYKDKELHRKFRAAFDS